MQEKQIHSPNVRLIHTFPDFKARSFCTEEYDRQFREHNIIIKANSKDVSYPEHWGPLSLKCCSTGNEHYRVGKRFYTVHSRNFLVLNQGQCYSSFIYSTTETASFTLNFTEEMQSRVTQSILCDTRHNLDDPFGLSSAKFAFTEKLSDMSSPIISLLAELKTRSRNFQNEMEKIEELLYLVLEQMIVAERRLDNEIEDVEALKPATKKELFKRLHYVKDYIDSCYQTNISLADLSEVANLNSAYLLRKFKKLFAITPRQYLIKKRMESAAELLKKAGRSVTEVCNETGYLDLASFGKLFKQFYHCSPENYRKQLIFS